MTRFVIAIAIALAIAGCEPPSAKPAWVAAGAREPQRGGTLRIASKDAITTLDPTYAYDETSYIALRPLVETLVDYEADGVRIVPRLAERWDANTDATAFRFWIRPGVSYADGTPIVAADFKFSLERALRTADSPFGPLLGDVSGAADVLAGTTTDCAGITTPTEHELVIQLARPNAGFLYTMAMLFTSPQRAAHVTAMGDQLRRRPLISGPYELVEWSEGVRYVVRRNPRYRGVQPAYLDGMILLEAVTRATQFLMFERGELDTAERLTPPDYQWVASQEAWKPHLHVRPMMNAFGARFDLRQKPFDDRRVRQALNYAVNKDHTTKLLAGASVPAHGMIPPGLFGRDESLAPYPYDPAKAKALLAEAGITGRLALELVTLADDEAERVAASVAADFAEVGVDLRISLVSVASYVALIGKAGQPGFAYTGWVADTPDPAAFFDLKFHSGSINETSSTNDSFYKNPALDAALDAGRAELDPAKRASHYQQAERILYEDAPWLWNYHQLLTEVTQPYVRGFRTHPVWSRDYATTWLDLGPGGERLRR